MKHSFIIGAVSTGLLLGTTGLSAADYSGNGNTGFGGTVGGSSLTLTDDGTTISGTLTKGPGDFNDALVIYIDSVSGGFSTTSGFTDGADGLRKSISGFDGGANRSTLDFTSGFLPDYAISLGPNNDNFGGLWTLANGVTLPFDASVNLTPTGTATSSTYTFSFTLASIGLTSGQTFELFGTYISDTGYRSDEAVAGNLTGAEGYGNTDTQTAFSSYTTTVVPEPSSVALVAMGALAFLRRRK